MVCVIRRVNGVTGVVPRSHNFVVQWQRGIEVRAIGVADTAKHAITKRIDVYVPVVGAHFRKRRVVEIDPGVDDPNQDTFSPRTDSPRVEGRTVPDTGGARQQRCVLLQSRRRILQHHCHIWQLRNLASLFSSQMQCQAIQRVGVVEPNHDRFIKEFIQLREEGRVLQIAVSGVLCGQGCGCFAKQDQMR